MSYYRIIRRNAAPPAPWEPNALGSALKVWLDASVASTLRSGVSVGSSASTGGGTVGTWINLANTSNGFWGHPGGWWDATRQTSQVNGLDVVRMASRGNRTIYGPGDGSARVHPLSASISGLTIIFVKKTPATLVRSAEGVKVLLSGGVGWAGLHLANLGSGYNAYWHLAFPTSGTLSAAPKTISTISASTTYMMVGRYEGSVSTALYLNGTLQDSQSNPAASLSLETSGDQMELGTGWGGADGSVGDNCEILLCDSALSTSDRQKAEGYLAHKWGLTSNLPNDHPYKHSAPTVEAGSVAATGGTVTVSGAYRYHTFTSNGDFVLSSSTAAIEYIIVAGGGGGGAQRVSANYTGGGGGAGGLLSGSTTLSAGTFAVVVGGGGNGGDATTGAGANGANSTFNGLTASGGGGGGGLTSTGAIVNPGSGGSGGGKGGNIGSGGNGTTGQGNNGGSGFDSGGGGSYGGGGGGAAAVGGQAGGSEGPTANGGAGSAWPPGSATYYAGGGGGGGHRDTTNNTGGLGGTGGGGTGGLADDVRATSSGSANTGGGGGGGARQQDGGAGGSGIVIIRYLV